MKRQGTIFPFLISLITLCLCLFAPPCSAQNVSGTQLRTVVIDPGHGGKDPGTVAPGGRNLEKQIVLSVALKLGKLIENAYPDVKVLYTRKTDVFVPLSERTDFANKNHADLFISIHVNSIRNNTAPSGSETFVMGVNKSESNMEVSKLENSVIAYEDDYNTTYQGFDPNNPESYIIFSLLQNAHLEQSVHFAELVQNALGRAPITINRGVKQGGLLVLWRSTMPAVLVELGFLSNAKDRQVLISEDGQQKLATALFNAFKQYKTGYDRQHQSTDLVKSNPEDTLVVQKLDASTPVYRVQIFAVSRLLPSNSPEFKGYSDIRYKKVGDLYKYTTGSFSSKAEAQTYCHKVRSDFPQAFVVENGM
ncbi:MAG: N-acetylmuramoyl-L-alanine amidase [Bacteroidales bacterium]|nr:N-acetylmuramoyl-L-alanine amidase [Bacteroidales bacterium]